MKSLQLSRVFNARRDRVFAYWTRGDLMQQWSGCKEATRCDIQMDFRVGGSFIQTMDIAGCGEFTVTGVFDEIVVPERIVYRVRIGGAMTRVEIQFFDLGERTRVVLTQEGFPDDVTVTHVTQGTTESFEKLERLFESAVTR